MLPTVRTSLTAIFVSSIACCSSPPHVTYNCEQAHFYATCASVYEKQLVARLWLLFACACC
jgi:hypothetical protein